jgi:hypothetical protein
MTSIKITPRYEDHLWYPILVKFAGYHHIIEMQGKEVNAWNDMINSRIFCETSNPRYII